MRAPLLRPLAALGQCASFPAALALRMLGRVDAPWMALGVGGDSIGALGLGGPGCAASAGTAAQGQLMTPVAPAWLLREAACWQGAEPGSSLRCLEAEAPLLRAENYERKI